jgi:prepilin-type N-terminal cleavage/methylation domain-containing protein/prepilin-type processing-associated H-X9-DG protein
VQSQPILRAPAARCRPGFTLVELLVVVAIIAVLIGLLLPALSNSRRSARDVQCASNIRQLCAGLLCYAAEWKGLFPPNKMFYDTNPPRVNNWMDDERAGGHIPSGMLYDPNPGYRGRVGGVWVCPEDEGAGRSYAMNIWASSVSYYAGSPRYGYCFRGPTVRESSKTILVTEVYSIYASPEGYLALAFGLGMTADLSPGQRFGNTRYLHNWGHPGDPVRYPTTPSMINYMNHRRSGDGGVGPETKGRLNIGYCDGHVEMKRHTDLVDWSTGKSRFDSLWSPNDYAHEETIGPFP